MVKFHGAMELITHCFVDVFVEHLPIRFYAVTITELFNFFKVFINIVLDFKNRLTAVSII